MPRERWLCIPILGVERVREAAEYYRDVLGFDLDPVHGVFQPSPAEPQGVYAILDRNGVRLHLQVRRGAVPTLPRPPHERDVYVHVDDVDALHSELERRGARFHELPHVAPHGIRELVVDDGRGHRIAFGEVDRP